MSLSGALNSATAGLHTTQGQSRIAADNVSNAMTPGYVRREAVLVTASGGQGGAVISEVRREVDATLQRMSRLENSRMTQYQSIQEGLTTYTAYLGQPGDGTSPADRFNDFQNSLTTLVNMPSSNGAQTSVALAAEDLVRSVKGAATTLSTTLNDVNMEIRYEVADLNTALYQLRDLNASGSGFTPGSLEAAQFDEKVDTILDQISGIVDTRIHRSSNGSISLYTVSGAALLEGRVVQDVTFNPSDGTLMAGNQDITPFKDGVRGIQHGSLAGLSELKRETIPQFSQQLDEYARGLIQTFEGADASLAPGEAGLFTDNGIAFDPANITGLASRLQINSKISSTGEAEVWRIRDGLGAPSPGAGSETVQINAFLAGLDTAMNAATGTGIPAEVTLRDFSAEMITSQAATRARAENDFNAAASAAEVVMSARRNSEGVNIDDEMQQLLLIEQSYAANSRVLTAVSEMIDTLIAAV
ncbi:flagellar hook-associated protein FlgK [Sulfitobacter pontiacus]|jgi:flagellar hook-associated protein 1 FlgK|uniref:flagellar hook-associated protein FlgK n=1 Tax=Sulfitobacter pontiacus TaxID=60137 RepID=UPI000E8F8694|nr:flagellar hook-associated protein FlgK [Sulfitobacter pontiacus]HBU53734.1 flagellar hook-associated protein FlgK [Sulfitobacter sp.]HCJ01120.1 flagellar hook-associated protein FlgK [Sulfitobacter sp.]HJO52318.1 flagellar hook-associated protein FlgK [Sulfitobacter pontiacus]|tara:strand:+ start:396 stop:1814 length:1419 start_codon:yes stop_codon:yes gene_type:complete